MKTIISTNNAPKAIGPYSQAVEANGMLFISGQIPIDPQTGQIVQGGIEAQTRQVLNNIQAILEAAGYGLNNVVKTTVYLKDLNDFAKMNQVYATFFDSQPPARAAFQVARLPLDVLIEIEAIAIK